MRRERDYRDDAYDVLKAHTKHIHEKLEELADIQKKIDSGVYVVEVQREFIKKRDELRGKISNELIPEAMAAAAAPFNQAIKELETKNALNGADLTEDAKLLTSGLKISGKDIDRLLAKPSNQNATMLRLISDYVEKHKISDPESGRAYKVIVPNQAIEIKRIAAERDGITKYYGRWIDKPNAFDFLDKAMPDQAAFARGDD